MTRARPTPRTRHRAGVAWLILALLTPGLVAATSSGPGPQPTDAAGDACGPEEDGAWLPWLEPPVRECTGEVTVADPNDSFRLNATEGDVLNMFVDAAPGAMFYVCFAGPAGSKSACLFDHELRVKVDRTGVWEVEINRLHGSGGPYALSVHLQEHVTNGRVALGHPAQDVAGVNRLAGPDVPGGVDGAWERLPETSTGVEMVRLHATTRGPVAQGLDVVFHDADGTQLPDDACTYPHQTRCFAPPGAAWAFIRGHAGAAHEYRFTYLH